MNIFTTAAFAALLCMSVAVRAEDREPVTIKVRHGDLDLRRADHRAALDVRIRRAAMIACGPVTADLRHNDDVARCRREMLADATTKVATLPQMRVALASKH